MTLDRFDFERAVVQGGGAFLEDAGLKPQQAALHRARQLSGTPIQRIGGATYAHGARAEFGG